MSKDSSCSGVDFSDIPRLSLYAAPRTPTTNSPYSTSALTTGRSTRNISRKRARVSYSPSKQYWDPDSPRLSQYASPGTVSPAPLANSRYRLATGYDTPTALQAVAYDQPSFSPFADVRFRQSRDEGVSRHRYECGLDTHSDHVGPLAKERNGVAQKHAPASVGVRSDYPWSVSRALVSTITGVAGFVFNFCTAGAFRGFTAGGGQCWTTDSNGTFAAGRADRSKQLARVEDSWQDSDFMQDEIPSPSYVRAAKKLKNGSEDNGGLQSSWIMVDSGRRSMAASPRTGSSVAQRPSSASRAGLRRVDAKPSLTKRRLTGSISIASLDIERHSASSADMRSPSSGHGSASRPGFVKGRNIGAGSNVIAPQSPLGKKGERLLKMKKKREREEDRELAKMNRRLEDMIRQGREALGTKYEVEALDEL